MNIFFEYFFHSKILLYLRSLLFLEISKFFLWFNLNSCLGRNKVSYMKLVHFLYMFYVRYSDCHISIRVFPHFFLRYYRTYTLLRYQPLPVLRFHATYHSTPTLLIRMCPIYSNTTVYY